MRLLPQLITEASTITLVPPHPRRLHRSSVLATLCALLSLAALTAGADLWANDERPDEGHPAPDFALKALDGRTVRLSQLRGKKVVLLNFWATWCPPCRLEMPTMQKIYADYKDKGLEILAINIESDATEEIREFMRELRLTFPLLLDPDMKVTRKYRLIGLPVSILIDRRGVIQWKTLGYHDWTDKESRSRIEALLK
jgi:peroxiredoxin